MTWLIHMTLLTLFGVLVILTAHMLNKFLRDRGHGDKLDAVARWHDRVTGSAVRRAMREEQRRQHQK